VTPGPEQPPRLVDQVNAGAGGAMTIEVGIITGDLTVATTDLGDHTARVMIQYAGADEWYQLDGSPAPIPQAGLPALHHRVLQAVTRRGGARASC
jgi:hypothetical protein